MLSRGYHWIMSFVNMKYSHKFEIHIVTINHRFTQNIKGSTIYTDDDDLMRCGGLEDAVILSGMVCNRTLPRCLSKSVMLVNIN
jgi:hypothetical protein